MMTDDPNNQLDFNAVPRVPPNRLKARYLAEHGDGPNTAQVLRIIDAICARAQANITLGPIEPKVKGAGSASYMAECMGLDDTP